MVGRVLTVGRRLSSTLAGMIRNEVRQVIQAELAPLLQEGLQAGRRQGQDQQQGQRPMQHQGSGQGAGSRPAVSPGQLSVIEQAILDALVRQGSLLMDSSGQGQGARQQGGKSPANGQAPRPDAGARQGQGQDNGQQSLQHPGVLARLAHLLGLGAGGEGVQPVEDAVPGRGVPPVLSPDGYQDSGSSIGDTGGGAGGAGGGVPGGQGSAQGAQTPADIYKEMEINLLKLRQVIQESEALAQRLEKLLHDEPAR